MRCLAFLTFILLLAGCNSSGGKDLPQGLIKDSIIPRSEMINILADIHVLEAALQVKRNKNESHAGIEKFYFNKLFSKYKVSEGNFKLNLSYYERNPENFMKMYEDVVKKLDSQMKLHPLK
jgi:hypothetical protein